MSDRRPGRRGAPHAAVALLCLAQFVDVLGVTVVVTALPSLLTDLRAPASATAPVVTGYAMRPRRPAGRHRTARRDSAHIQPTARR